MSIEYGSTVPQMPDSLQFGGTRLVVRGEPTVDQFIAFMRMSRILLDLSRGAAIPARSYRGSGVYAFINARTLVAYIGSSACIRRRFYEHISDIQRKKHCNRYLQRACDKGEEFIAVVIEECEVTNLLPREQAWIDFWGMKYNAQPIAGRIVLDAAARQRIGAINATKTRSPELRARISDSLRGRNLPPEHKTHISFGLLRHYAEPSNRLKIGIKTRASWERQDVREKRVAGITAAAQTTDGRSRLSRAANARWAGHKKEKSCGICGATFQYRESSQETCSSLCAHRLAWQRRRERSA